jgi:hypothetical protein
MEEVRATPVLRSVEEPGDLGEGVPFHEKATPVRRVGQPDDTRQP